KVTAKPSVYANRGVAPNAGDAQDVQHCLLTAFLLTASLLFALHVSPGSPPLSNRSSLIQRPWLLRECMWGVVLNHRPSGYSGCSPARSLVGHHGSIRCPTPFRPHPRQFPACPRCRGVPRLLLPQSHRILLRRSYRCSSPPAARA